MSRRAPRGSAAGVVAIVAAFLGAVGCGQNDSRSPSAPSAAPSAPPAAASGAQAATYPSESPSGPVSGSTVINFPPRDQPNAFFEDLTALYRDVLGRTQSAPTYVDPEGENVWLTEYFRFYLNGCSHQEAMARTLREITSGGTEPVCGNETPVFPPRNLPNEFQGLLEATYRDVLRRPQTLSFVDSEGANVWLAQYLRFRVSGCDHLTAESKVFTEIRGGGVQPICGPVVVVARADFTVIPDSGTNVNPGQCAVTRTTGPRNVLQCTFDARSSTPRPGITSYAWSVPGQDAQTRTSGEQINGMTLPCGTFPGGNTTDKTIRLTVAASGSSDSVSKVVTFVKQGPC